jgi:pimeloyl-ACP methyl ester carboxylesterase
MTYTTKYYEVRGLSLAYHEWGQTNSPTIFFFHGFLDHGLSFAPVARELARDFRVIAPDARGHGHSDWIGQGGYYHFADYFHDICSLVEKLQIERLHLVGHSMGGSIATGVAAILGDRIESTVMLEGMGPPHEPFDDLPKRLERWHRGLSKSTNAQDRQGRKQSRKLMPDIKTAADRLSNLNSRLPEEGALGFAKTFTEEVQVSGQKGVVWRYDPLHRTIGSRAFRFEEAQHLWRSIHGPCLSLWGKESVFRPENVERRHRCLNDVKVALVHDSGHNIHHDQPEIVTGLIRNWIGSDRHHVERPGVTICGLDLVE